MERDEAERVVNKAKAFVDKHGIDCYVEVEELDAGRPIEDQIIEVSGGSFVRAFVFVPSIP